MNTETQAGRMSGREVTHHQHTRFDKVLAQWQAAVNLEHPADQVHGHFGAKYARLDVGGSGAFMVEIQTGIIHCIKGYGKVYKEKIVGNIYDLNFDAAVLVRDRFRNGHFENDSNGSRRVG